MSKSRHPRRAPDSFEAAPEAPSRDRIDPYAAMAEDRDPTPEEIHAWVHAHDPIPLRDRIHPMHGPYETIPRDEDGRIHSWFFCTPDEIEALQNLGCREPPRRYRKDGWTPQDMVDFIDALSSTASIAGACAYIGKSRMSAYRLRNRADAGHFRRAWDEALRNCTAVLADTAYQRAVEGVKKTIWYKGEAVGEEQVYNDRLLMFLLRVRDPINFAPIDQLDRAQRHRPLVNQDGMERLMHQVEATEESWRSNREILPPGEARAVEMLTEPATPCAQSSAALPPTPFVPSLSRPCPPRPEADPPTPFGLSLSKPSPPLAKPHESHTRPPNSSAQAEAIDTPAPLNRQQRRAAARAAAKPLTRVTSVTHQLRRTLRRARAFPHRTPTNRRTSMAQGLTTLTSLTQTAIDSAMGYEKASELAKTPQLKQLLSQAGARRRGVIADLNNELVRLGGSAQTSGSTAGAAHRVWTQITDAFSSGDEAAVERVEEGEDYIEKKFREALDNDDWDPQTRQVVQAAHTQIAEAERMADQLEDQYD